MVFNGYVRSGSVQLILGLVGMILAQRGKKTPGYTLGSKAPCQTQQRCTCLRCVFT